MIARISGVLGTLAETPSYRSQIVQQDGIDAIVRPCFVISSPRVLFAICRALRNFTRGRFSDTIVRCLVYLLRSSKSGRVLGAAATIIWDLAFANVDNCMRLVRGGGGGRKPKRKSHLFFALDHIWGARAAAQSLRAQPQPQRG